MCRIGLHYCALAAIVFALLAPLGASESYAQTTYGEDPIPNSQFWNHQLTQGYGVDPVPQSSTNETPSQRFYGVDPIPDARYYRRTNDVTPLFLRSDQVLTLAEDDNMPAEGDRCVPRP
jgi:hypothetical protein